MSQENVEIVRSIYADPRGLTAGASGKVAPDAEFDLSDAYPDAPILRGVEAFRRFRDSGPWSGSPVAHEFTIHDNLVVRFKVYRSRDRALEAAGLREWAAPAFGSSDSPNE